MKFKLKFLAAVVYMAGIYIVSSCSSEIKYSLPEYNEDTSVSFEIMTDELVGLDYIRDIYCYGPYIIVVSVSLKDWTLIHVFDKDTGAYLSDILNRGRGPGEYLYDGNSHFDTNTGEMRIYDSFKNSMLEFHIDSLMKYGAAAVRECPLIENTYMLQKTLDYGDRHLTFRNESFLHRETSDVVRFALTDAGGDTLSVYNAYPEIENDGVRWQIYQSCHLSVSPSYDRMAVGCFYSGILETFSLSEGEIRSIATGYFSRPDFHWNGGMIYTDMTTAGFGDVFAAEDRIYTVFDGETKLKDYESSPDTSELLHDICVFDWTCRPSRRIRTDCRVERICVDGDNVILYAVVKDSQGRSYLGRIRL